MITIAVSPGELADKISILKIKLVRVADATKLQNIGRELTLLTEVWQKLSLPSGMDGLVVDLHLINDKLWVIEDKIRACERNHDFGPGFVSLARAVYINNDIRSNIKRTINKLMDSDIKEEKEYTSY